MNPVRRSLAALLALAPFGAVAQQRRSAVVELNPTLPVDDPAKIEVIEFFRYSCGYCYQLQPLIEPWAKKLPADVAFRRVPAVFNNRREAYDASIFYTFDAMGILEKQHRPFFDAIHRDRLKVENLDVLTQWLRKQGIDEKRFVDTAKSMGVDTSVKRATLLTSSYKPDGTPAMAVHGRFTVSPEESHGRMLETVNQLIAVVRKKK